MLSRSGRCDSSCAWGGNLVPPAKSSSPRWCLWAPLWCSLKHARRSRLPPACPCSRKSADNPPAAPGLRTQNSQRHFLGTAQGDLSQRETLLWRKAAGDWPQKWLLSFQTELCCYNTAADTGCSTWTIPWTIFSNGVHICACPLIQLNSFEPTKMGLITTWLTL